MTKRDIASVVLSSSSGIQDNWNHTELISAFSSAYVRFSGNAPKRLSRPVNALDGTAITAGVAEAHTILGDNGRAIEMLDGLLSRPSYIAAGDLKINPVWNPLPSDPRFQKLCEEKQPGILSVNYWEIIADNLSKAGWSWGRVSAVDVQGGTIWITDAHRDDGNRYVVRADEKLTAFLELESQLIQTRRNVGRCPTFFYGQIVGIFGRLHSR